MKGQFLTHRGLIRDHNEDAGGVYKNTADQLLAIIADGMGGHQAGDVASRMATEIIQDKWKNMSVVDVPEQAETWLQDILKDVNQILYNHSAEHKECKGMGTTIVIAVCTEEFFTVAHVGDSRCYLLNEYGFKQITEDHSLVNALIQSGQISKSDAQQHPRKNVVLKALGTEENVVPEIQSLTWSEGAKLLLCSDGLTDKVADDEIAQCLSADEDLIVIGDELIEMANQRGGEDNISLVLLLHESTEKSGDRSC
ncbi:MAG TPA: Stp1/IreP family PP2C-type Ser/Thr phosphatase [Bacillota bacterium]|nr:Stp1/IreP family PP2C-type Ser/Thr phosphatase [Bacillota bacterium]